jgi:RNA polymerase sigma-70 factor (ECF subfamily)
MSEATHSTTQIQLRLDRLRAGDESARDELLSLASDRLTRLARRMLRSYPGVQRWEQTDDVLQNAAVRLCRALKDVKPASVRSFINLAAVQIRRELIDLARHYEGPEGMGRHQARGAGPHGPGEVAAESDDPDRLAVWGEFHEAVESLSAEAREVFDLLWYQGLSQGEAAALLGVSVRVVKYRWRMARLEIHQRLGGRMPE